MSSARKFVIRQSLAVCATLGLSLLLATTCANAGPRPARDWKPILDQLGSITVLPLPDWRFHPDDGSPGEAPEADDSGWQAYRVGQEWTSGPVWLRQWVEIPAKLSGYDVRGARLLLRVRHRAENTALLLVYANGAQVAESEELDTVVVSPRVEPGAKYLLAVKVQVLPGRSAFAQLQVEVEPAPGRPDPRRLLEECQSADTLIKAFAERQEERASYVDAALGAIDWGALDRGDQQGFDRSLQQAQQKLEPLRDWLKNFSIYAVGNSHIDMAWLWPWTETVEVVRRTFTSALSLLQEFPDFTFTMSSAQTYAWMEEKYPGLFQQIRRRVREGRWEPIGGMWVEPDLNMPDGESIVRQLLVGKRYFQQKFGVDIRTGWNPDSFGYNWQLPQIYKKSGVDFFVTQKLIWNDTTRFPYSLFWWEAPDGSRVLTYFPQGYVNSMDPLKMARDLADFQQRADVPELMHLYGVGDHGGGPTAGMLRDARRWQEPGALYPRLSLGPAQPYLDKLAEKAGTLRIPTWKDELYLEFHRGVYTSQAETKKNNRRNEVLLLEAERFAALASVYGQPYPQADLNEAWKKVLFNQFHDVISGSGIHPVYVDAERDHQEVRRAGNEILVRALAELAAHAQTQGPGVPVIVLNPLSWPRTDVVEAEAQFSHRVTNLEVRGPSGRPVLAEIVARDSGTHRVHVRFVAEDIPPVGYAVFHLVLVSRARKIPSPLAARADTLENEFVLVRVDPETGCMTSLLDKVHSLEVLAPSACGNLLQAFVDQPKQWDAWNIDADFEDHKWDLTRAEEVRLVESSAVRAVLRVVKKFQSSTFTQDITLYPHIPRVDVEMSADWHEKHILLKVAFPLAVHSDFATFEIPYGSIQRPTTRHTPAEKAKFEVPALRWADLSDSKQGLSLLNDCKYGYDARDNVLRLSLLRSPIWPDPEADQGFHRFTYSLYPHAGGWKQADTLGHGYELNTPLLALVTTPHPGPLPASYSFVELAPNNLVLTAIKKSEVDDALIFRFYEFAGEKTEARLRLPPGAVQAVETNLSETPQRDLALQSAAVVILTGPYEIKCVKVRFASTGRGSPVTGERR